MKFFVKENYVILCTVWYHQVYFIIYLPLFTSSLFKSHNMGNGEKKEFLANGT